MSSKTFNLVGGSSSGIKLVSISIINPPNKVNYKPGEIFDPAGMKIQATYSNQATVIATGWTFIPDSPLSENTDSITILYSEGGITVQTKQIITVTKKILQIPTQKGTLTYTGDIQSPSWNNYDNSEMLLTGTTSGLNANSYVAKFNLKNPIGTQWSDGSIIEKDVSWSIERATISSIPTQSGTLTYNGSVQSPKWTGYDSAKMKISGTTSSTNAGTFSASFTPTDNYKWNDGTINAKNVNWTINKAAGSLSLSTSSVNLTSNSKTKTVTVTRAGNGVITATSNAASIATVSVSGTTLTITGKSTGNTTITVKVAEGTNHNAPANKTISVSVQLWNGWGSETEVGDSDWWDGLKNWTINASSAERKACVGKTKRISLSPTLLGGSQVLMRCVGADQDGVGTLTFTAVSALPNKYKFDNYRGYWIGSVARDQVCQLFYDRCSAKNAIKTVKKGTCSSANISRNSNVSYNDEKVFLLSEREYGLDLCSSISVENSTTSKAECTYGYNAAYNYFTNNSTRVTYLGDSIGNPTSNYADQWTRSVYYADSKYISKLQGVIGGQTAGSKYDNTQGYAPAFVIG